jgi:hypothetical protein
MRQTRSKLRLDGLAVESFETGTAPSPERGTVHGHACTDGNSCRCPTSYAQCGTGPATIYSCQRTVFDCA